MKTQWFAVKQLISSLEAEKPYLSVISSTGKIFKANSRMKKEFALPDPSHAEVNFLDLVHPVNQDGFRKLLESTSKGISVSTELYLKNGVFHPMKWAINTIEIKGQKAFLCGGRKLLSNDRLELFNQLGKENYQVLIESLNAAVIFHDINGELIASNQKTAELFSTTLERLYQLTDIRSLWDNMWHVTTETGEIVKFDETPFMRSLKSGKRESQLLVVSLANGEKRWMHFTSQPLINKQTSVAYTAVSNVIDLTEEKRALLELVNRKAIFGAFMKQSPNLAWVVDEDATLLEANNIFYSFFGLKESETKNKNILELVPDSVSKALYEKHLQVIESGKASGFTEKVKWANGTEFAFFINIFLIEGLSGKKILGGEAINLTDKYESEKRLKEANDRLLLLTRATTDAIWEWDMQTGKVFRNDALMDMIGYEADQHKGLSWWLRSIHPEDRNRVSDKVKQSTDSGSQSWEDEYRFKCADGNYKHMRDRGYIVYENGLPVKMIGSLQDISELKKMEDELFEEKLRQQKELSETIVRVQEKERTRIGHELHDNVNQLLSTTKLFVDMINPSTEDEKMFKSKSLEYILTAIEEIRKLSKELVVPQLKGNSLVGNIKHLIEDIELSGTLQIKFTHDHENDILSPGKKVTIFRILQEQMKNILKYSKASQVDILLQCKDKFAELTIIDNGIGFDPQKTRKGIGLSSIYERTRFYNGKMDINSSPGNGCKLVVGIPCYE